MYDGLKIEDKPALLDAKARGAEWVARDYEPRLFGYSKKPRKYRSRGKWIFGDGNLANQKLVELDFRVLLWIDWSDTEPVNIDLAIAQIAEMEKSEKQEESGCEFCKHYAKPSVVIWDSHVLAMVGEDKPHKPFIKIELKARKNEAELVVVSQGLDNRQNSVVMPIRYCPNCGRKIASPYTEGDKR